MWQPGALQTRAAPIRGAATKSHAAALALRHCCRRAGTLDQRDTTYRCHCVPHADFGLASAVPPKHPRSGASDHPRSRASSTTAKLVQTAGSLEHRACLDPSEVINSRMLLVPLRKFHHTTKDLGKHQTINAGMPCQAIHISPEGCGRDVRPSIAH